MILPKDYKEFIALLNGKSVRYVLVGAHASAYHGMPRTTSAIDFFVEKSPANIALLVSVLEEFGFPVGAFSADVFEQDVIQLGIAPVRIDLLTSLSGVTFDEVAVSAAHDEVDGVMLPIISKDVLIKNRKATGRLKDIADIHALERVNPNP